MKTYSAKLTRMVRFPTELPLRVVIAFAADSIDSYSTNATLKRSLEKEKKTLRIFRGGAKFKKKKFRKSKNRHRKNR